MGTVTMAQLEQRRDELKRELSRVQDMRRGSLVERYRKCGKASCACAGPQADGHGPCWSLTWQEDGKTSTRVIPAATVERTRSQIQEYRRFRGLTRELVKLSEQICERQLAHDKAEAQATAKKGGSESSSLRKFSRRSRR